VPSGTSLVKQCQSCKMINFASVPNLLCDPFTWFKYRDTLCIKTYNNFLLSCYKFINKGFSVALDNYWSSSSIAGNSDNAWNVNFNNGNDNGNNKSNLNYVRCVRDNG